MLSALSQRVNLSFAKRGGCCEEAQYSSGQRRSDGCGNQEPLYQCFFQCVGKFGYVKGEVLLLSGPCGDN